MRCAPPANEPTPEERDTCAPWLARELALLPRLRVIVVAGRLRLDGAVAGARRPPGYAVPRPRPAFGHGVEVELPGRAGRSPLLGSYHVSQQNTFTGRLTEPMLDAVLGAGRGAGAPSSRLTRSARPRPGLGCPAWRNARILVVGGGYVGMYTALRLQQKLRRGRGGDHRRRPAAAHDLPAVPARGGGRPHRAPARRGAAAPMLRTAEVLTGAVIGLDHARQAARGSQPVEGAPFELSYDVLVMAPGSVARTLPIPGLAEHGIGFKTVEEAICLRNHVLDRLDVGQLDRRPRGAAAGCSPSSSSAAATPASRRWPSWRTWPATRRATTRACRPARHALGAGRGHRPDPARGRRGHGRATRSSSCDKREHRRPARHPAGVVRRRARRALSDGEEFDADTIVWTAGVKANPMLAETDLPLDDTRPASSARPTCRSRASTDAWAAGDCAAVPDLTGRPGATMCSPSAQHAVRQAKRAGRQHRRRRCAASSREPYRHKHVGSVASLGLHKGVAQVYGVKLRACRPGSCTAPTT